jgi:hypothetical protein
MDNEAPARGGGEVGLSAFYDSSPRHTLCVKLRAPLPKVRRRSAPLDSSVMITVWSGLSPPPLEPLALPELAHLEVFTSRSSEEGRQRYRLHVGYFADPSAAARVLPRVREIYPSAWVVPASRHKPLVRLKVPDVRSWTGDFVLPTAPDAPPPRGVLLEPKPLSVVEFPEVDAAADPASGPTAEPMPTDNFTLSDEISLDVAEILALLEESDSSAPPLPTALAGDPGKMVSLEDTELTPAAPPTAQISSRESPVSTATTPLAASPAPFHAFSRFSVEEWRPEPPIAAEAPAARSWLKRLPKLNRLTTRRRANN